MRKNDRRRLIWIALGAATAILLYVVRPGAARVESVYGEGLYPVLRWFFGHTLGVLPFPAIWAVAALLIWLLIKRAVLPGIRGKWNWRSLVLGTLSTVGAMYFLFYLLWGVNYSRERIPERMNLVAEPLDSSKLVEEYQRISALLWAEFYGFRVDSAADWRHWSRGTDRQLVADVGRALDQIGFPLSYSPRGRVLTPKGALLRINTAGVYIPYSGEGHIDGGLHKIQYPFTMAHELAHGYGVADEGDCNFIAYLACVNSSSKYVRVSGLLSYWRYVASDYRRLAPEAYRAQQELFPPELVQLLREIAENNARYPDFMPRLRNAVYDAYLRSNGVRDGLMSYSRIVRLVYAYERKDSAG